MPPSSSYHRLRIDTAANTSLRRRSEGDAQRRNNQQQQQQPMPTIAIGMHQPEKQPETATAAAAIGTATPSPPPPKPVLKVPPPPPVRLSSLSGSSSGTPQKTKIATTDATAAAADDDDEDPDAKQAPTTAADDDDPSLVRCRYPRCTAAAVPPAVARHTYKTCHNCAHQYCSRECRRAHWDRHRRACLHSRVSALCRQVLAACKDDTDALVHLSRLARRGFSAHGRGVVRLLFRTAEAAEQFVRRGFQALGEASYVRWPELLPQEMGAELYAELLRLSTEYRPDAKMLVYVAVCVVSETPAAAGAGAGAVRWERQLVSRCAKLKLSRLAVGRGGVGGGGEEVREVLLAAQTAEDRVTPEIISATTGANVVVAGVNDDDNADDDDGANMDVMILTFGTAHALTGTVERRTVVQANIVRALRERGVQLRKHFPDVWQRLGTFVDGTAGGAASFAPVTIHPRDVQTGRAFLCIVMAQPTGEGGLEMDAEMRRLMGEKCGGGSRVRVIDCSAAVEETDPRPEDK